MPPTSTSRPRRSATRRREGEEQQVAAGHEGVRQAARVHLDLAFARQRGVGDLAEQRQVEQVVVAETRAPSAETLACSCVAHVQPALELDARGAGRSRSRSSRRARSGPAPRRGRWWSPGRRRTARGRGGDRSWGVDCRRGSPGASARRRPVRPLGSGGRRRQSTRSSVARGTRPTAAWPRRDAPGPISGAGGPRRARPT